MSDYVSVVDWYIYALRDPITWEQRYVGKTVEPKRRFSRHLNETPSYKSHVGRWLAKLKRSRCAPLVEILDRGTSNGYQAAERGWVALLRSRGAPLTNATPGGDGGSGSCTEEARRKISLAHRGRPKTSDQRAKISASKTGVKQSPESIEKRRLKLIGHTVSPETREKIAATKRGKPRNAETIAKMSAALTGRKLPEETRAKLRISQAARRERERREREAHGKTATTGGA